MQQKDTRISVSCQLGAHKYEYDGNVGHKNVTQHNFFVALRTPQHPQLCWLLAKKSNI